MRLPLILVDSTGWVEVYDSAEDLVRDVEHIDVINGEYVVYDAEGRLLTLQVKYVSRRLCFWKVSIPVIELVEAEQVPTHHDDLKHALLRFLRAFGCVAAVSEHWSLSDLISRVVQATRR